jgi:hypothetical protein
MRTFTGILLWALCFSFACKTTDPNRSIEAPSDQAPSPNANKNAENNPVPSPSIPQEPLITPGPVTPAMPPESSPSTTPKPPTEVKSNTSPAATLSGLTSWFGSEMRTKSGYGAMGSALRISWQAKPARGNCVITLLSLFNGDRIFTTQSGSWSEITFEIFGGAHDSTPDFQTQYITRGSPNDLATTRGKDHAVQHKRGGSLANIFDDRFHLFQIEWMPSQDESASLTFRVDGKEIRRESGGDLKKLEGNLDIYTSVWISKWPGEPSAWGCSDDKTQRPDSSFAVVENFLVEQFDGSAWRTLETRSFEKAADIWTGFDHSDWGFESFAGKYCPGNAVWQNNSQVRLDLTHSCPARP